MSESNVAQDELKAFVRRIESVEDEINALNSDKSEIYKEAKSSGFDTKQLRKVIQKRRLPQSEREEQDTVFDLYWDAVHSSERTPAHARVENIEEFPAKNTLAALRTNPDLAIVEATVLERSKTLPTKAAGQVQGAATASVQTSLPGAEGAEDREIITEPQPSQPAGSDLTSLAPHEGQVAPIPAAVEGQRSTPVTDVGGSGEAIQPETANDDRSCVSVLGGLAPSLQQQATREGEAARPLPPIYADPGVVTWESTPPEGVERHPYSNAFGTLGQDAVVIADDIAKASAQPIVKMGNVILDGWARYMTARGAVGLDGQSTEYPVVQYNGTDPLLDCIRWNIAGRILSDKDKQTVVARLIAIEPKRKAEIIKAVAEMAI